MSDPATEAALRAINSKRLEGPLAAFTLHGAIEALKPVRELHKPCVDIHGDRYCDECICYGSIDNVPWPCDTALLIYSEGEL